MIALGEVPQRSSETLKLPSEFALPADRPRQHRRITQLSEWPKILEHLLQNARGARGGLVRPDFSVADVEKAYVATGANMPRNPARRFLADLARSRNVAKLLLPVTDAGLTIIHVGDNGTYGRFVPKGTPEGIDAKEGLHVTSREIPDATVVRTKLDVPLSGTELLRHLKRRQVGERLFGDTARIQLEGAKNLLGDFEPGDLRFKAMRNDRCVAKGTVLLVHGKNLPLLAQLNPHLKRTGERTVLVVATLTKRHFAAFLVVEAKDRLRVRRKSVFQIVVTHEPLEGAGAGALSADSVANTKGRLSA